MGLLNADYYKRAPAAQAAPPVATVPPPSQPAGGASAFSPKPLPTAENPAAGLQTPAGSLSPEEQAQKFGGPVGSVEYQKFQANRPVSSYLPKATLEAAGLNLPDQESWDRMTTGEKLQNVRAASVKAAVHLVAAAPLEILKAPVRLSNTLLAGAGAVADKLSGKQGSFMELANQQQVPVTGIVPNYFNTYDEARKSGIGPIGATIIAGNQAFGDATISIVLGNDLKASFRPRARAASGAPVLDIKPIQRLVDGTRKVESVSEYYSMPKSVAKKYGGNEANTFWKMTPAQGGTEISIVQKRGGVLSKAVDRIKGRGEQVYQGDFGPEIKLQSQTLPVDRSIVPDVQQPEILPLIEQAKKFQTSKEFIDSGTIKPTPGVFWHGSTTEGITQLRAGSGNLGKGVYLTDSPNSARMYGAGWAGGVDPGELADMSARRIYRVNVKSENLFKSDKTHFGEAELKKIRDDGFDGIEIPGEETIIFDPKNVQVVETIEDIFNRSKTQSSAVRSGQPSKMLPSIPDKPLKGFADKPVTAAHVENLANIARAANLDETLAQSVVRSVTGKSAVGELTQAEYVETARAMAGLAKASKLADGTPVVNPVSQYLSPQRHFTRAIEERGGPPIYSQGYVPIEDAFQNRRVFTDGVNERLSEMYGKYESPRFAEERRLIRDATEGNVDAITKNEALTPETKAELLDIVEKRKAFYDEFGPLFGIDKEHFIENYSPRIQDIGGVYQLYKEGTDIPKEFTPFFENKRKGALHVQVDDALALDQIYVRAGANKLYLNPALKNVNGLIESLEPTLRGSMRSYIQEKLGYAGRAEQYLDEAVPKMLGKLGIHAPGDVGRQAAQFVMNTTYSGALGFRLGSAVRNAFQAFNSYIRQGPEFFGQAIAKAATKEGVNELRKRGLLVRLGVPSGADLAQEASMLGKAKSRYTRFTQASLVGQEVSDAFSRATTFWQGKYKWDDAISRFKSGELDWSGFEKKMDFDALSPADQNIVRKAVVGGDVDSAFNHYIREIIDETQFPFRRGASFRAGYGLAGKAGFQFAQWPIEQAHMLGSWLKRGQYDKLIRWHATATALTRSMNEMFGVDVKDSYGIRTVVPGAAPLVKMAQDLYGAFEQFSSGNQEEFAKHVDGLSRALMLFVPAGIQLKAISDFHKSVKAGPIGPDGTFPVYSASGKLNRYATFRELWQKLWGFQPSAAAEASDLGKQMRNASFLRSDKKQQALQLLQSSLSDDGSFDTSSEKYQDAMRMIQENGLQIGASDLKAYYIPANERTFQQLPRPLQAEFAPRVFPSP